MTVSSVMASPEESIDGIAPDLRGDWLGMKSGGRGKEERYGSFQPKVEWDV